ncbi:MAG: glycosyltransferase family 2 protein [bacterium]
MSENHKTKFSEPLVYLIILNWNGKADTLECLSSLEKIQYSNYRICLVDNASTDDSVAAVRNKFPQVEVIENSENLRFARGNNVGIQYALEQGADYLLLLNNDTKVDSEFLKEMMKVSESDSIIGMVGPKIYYYDPPDVIWSAGGKISFWTGKISHRGLRKRDSEVFNKIVEVDYLTACALCVKKEVIEKVGLLDSSYFIYAEDADWCERTRRAGFQLVFVPKAKIWHKISSTSGGGLTPFKALHKVKSNFLFFKKYARWYHWLTIPIFISGGTLWFTMKQFTHGNFAVISSLLKGFKEIIKT